MKKTLLKSNDIMLKYCATAFIICDTLFIFLTYFRTPWDYNGDWQASEILFNYKYGFIKRGLLGTLFELAAKVFNVSDKEKLITVFQFSGVIIFTAMILLLVLYMIKKVNGVEATRGVMLIAVMFSLLGGIGFFYYDWGSPDSFLVSLTVVAVFAILSGRCLWAIPLISSVCVMIHEGYVLMYFSVIFALLFYRMSMQTDKKKKQSYLIILFITTACSAVLFFYFYFFSKVSDEYSLSMVLTDIRAVIGNNTQRFNIEYILFGGYPPCGALSIEALLSPALITRLEKLFAQLLPFVPMIIFILSFWIYQIKNAVGFQNKFVKFVCCATEAVVIPLFMMHADLSRWAVTVFFYEFVMICVLLIDGDSDAVNYFKKLRIIKKPIYSALFFAYVIALGFPFYYNKFSLSLLSRIAETYICG